MLRSMHGNQEQVQVVLSGNFGPSRLGCHQRATRHNARASSPSVTTRRGGIAIRESWPVTGNCYSITAMSDPLNGKRWLHIVEELWKITLSARADIGSLGVMLRYKYWLQLAK